MALGSMGAVLSMGGPMADMLRDQFAGTFVGSLRPSGLDLVVGDWAPAAVTGVGDQAAAYSFRFRVRQLEGDAYQRLDAPFPAEGDGAYVIFTRGGVTAVLMVFNTDGRSVDDLRQYAPIADARIPRG